MKIARRWFFVLANLSACGSAQEISLAPQFDPFDGARQVSAFSLRTEETTDGGGTADVVPPRLAPRYVDRDVFVGPYRSGGLIGGVELAYLRPYATGNLLFHPDLAVNFNPTMRYWIGWQSAEGLGVRVRYWQFDHQAQNGPDAITLEFRTLDAEVTQIVDFLRWDLLISGGMRYAESDLNNTLLEDPGFDGVGLTFGLQAARDLNQTGSLRLAASGRWSSVFGNTKKLGSTPVNDDLMNIVELTFGPQYRRLLGNGAFLTIGCGLEAQYWSNGYHGDTTDDVGFAGFSSSVAVTR